jgi:hypothetical protein
MPEAMCRLVAYTFGRRHPKDLAAVVDRLHGDTKGGILQYIVKPRAQDIQDSLDLANFCVKYLFSISDYKYQTQYKVLWSLASKSLGLEVCVLQERRRGW